MNKNSLYAILALFICSSSAYAQGITCSMSYSLKGWSFIYKEYSGTGVVSCSNGQQQGVYVISKGGGFTFGKSEIDNGHGKFSRLYNLNEVFGTYIAIDGHAGVLNSVEGRVMTKGEVSLALSGMGRGMDFGFSLSAFTIRPR